MSRRRLHRLASSAGTTLIEALVAAAIFTVLVASVLGLVERLQGTLQAEPERADLQQRTRVAVEQIQSALNEAGAGPLVGATRGSLGRYVASVLPYRIGRLRNDPESGVRYRPDVLSVLSVPLTGAQAVLRDGAAVDATFLTLEWPASCPPPSSATVCGFGPGTSAVVFDRRGRWDLVTVESAAGSTVTIDAPGLRFAYSPGAVVSEVRVDVLSLRVDAQGISQLSRYDGFVAEFPIVEHVESVSFEYFGEPLPPQRLGVPLDNTWGPWTTYGPSPPLAVVDDPDDTWPAGENCVFQIAAGEHVPRLATLSTGRVLVTLDPATLRDGPWCPDAGNPHAYDADLLRVRRVRATLRLQVASSALRGAASAFFLRGGSSTTAERLVPDQEIVFDVAPANLSFGR
ncbi:MAG: hypothetical protein ABL986_11915 [Vicinamibacterales bacterium]